MPLSFVHRHLVQHGDHASLPLEASGKALEALGLTTVTKYPPAVDRCGQYTTSSLASLPAADARTANSDNGSDAATDHSRKSQLSPAALQTAQHQLSRQTLLRATG